MDFSTYTERSRGFIQSAQTQALARGHQRFTPEHVAKVLLEDSEGLASNLIRAAGGSPELALNKITIALEALPRVEGAGAGQLYPTPELARFFELAQEIAKRKICVVYQSKSRQLGNYFLFGYRQLGQS